MYNPSKTDMKGKITLQTLPKATAQEVFDYVVTHLLTQNKHSIMKDDYGVYGAAYFSSDKTRCGAGCLMGEDEYRKHFEGKGWGHLVAKFNIPNNHNSLISTLQMLHDEYKVIDWKDQLKNIAKTFNLNENVLINFNKENI